MRGLAPEREGASARLSSGQQQNLTYGGEQGPLPGTLGKASDSESDSSPGSLCPAFKATPGVRQRTLLSWKRTGQFSLDFSITPLWRLWCNMQNVRFTVISSVRVHEVTPAFPCDRHHHPSPELSRTPVCSPRGPGSGPAPAASGEPRACPAHLRATLET